MAKSKTIKQMAVEATYRYVDRLTKSSRDIGKAFSIGDDGLVKPRMGNWLGLIFGFDADILEKAEPGEFVQLAGENILAADLKIIRQWHQSDAAEVLLKAHDDRRTFTTPERLWQPTLFDKYNNYSGAVRDQWVPLGDSLRTTVGNCTPEQWVLRFGIQEANFQAQKAAFEKEQIAEERRKKLFHDNDECKTTDQLMKKLGVYKL